MQSNTDISQIVFQETKDIIEKLSKIDTINDLINSQNSIAEIQELISFLKVSNRYSNEAYVEKPIIQVYENQEENLKIQDEKSESFDIEEEVIFNNELNEIDDSEINYSQNEDLEEEAVFNNEFNEIERQFEEEQDQNCTNEVNTKGEIIEELSFEENVDENLQKSDEPERRGKILEFSKEEKMQELNTLAEEIQEKKEKESRIKLANIKGLKKVEKLFDDDPVENMDESVAKTNKTLEKGSLLKTNIPTNFMEAEKEKPVFKLDLNDRIAFTKTLFSGSQTDLNETVNRLNSYKTLEEAKEYLSEIYYQKNWKKADEYAQRLWSLVENKFQ